jgi:hypothetical protein
VAVFGRLILATAIVSAITACDTTPPDTAEPSPSPAQSSPTPPPTPTNDYLKVLTGYRYASLEVKSGVDFRSPLQNSALLREAVRGYTVKSITYNGDPYGVTVEVFDIDPLVAGRSGIQEDLVATATGRTDTRDVGIGARSVAYFNVSNFTSFMWLQATSFVIVSAEPATVGKAFIIAEALIDANTTESRFFITGQVLSAKDGNPVPDVSIWVTLSGRDCCANVVPGVASGPTGRYQIRVPEGDYHLLFYPTGLAGFGASWYRDATDFESSDVVHVVRNTPSIDARLPAGRAVSGHISSNGQPVKGAHVDAYSVTTGGWVAGFDASDGGGWVMRLATGRYRLQFWPPGGSTLRGVWWRSGDSIRTSEVLIIGDADLHDLDVALPGNAL